MVGGSRRGGRYCPRPELTCGVEHRAPRLLGLTASCRAFHRHERGDDWKSYADVLPGTAGGAMSRRVVLPIALLAGMGCGEAPLDAVRLPSAAIADNLVAHWDLDDGSGSFARDTSGNGYDGELRGGSWISDGRFGGGLRFVAGQG